MLENIGLNEGLPIRVQQGSANSYVGTASWCNTSPSARRSVRSRGANDLRFGPASVLAGLLDEDADDPWRLRTPRLVEIDATTRGRACWLFTESAPRVSLVIASRFNGPAQ